MSKAPPGRSLLRTAWHDILDVVFPPQCVSCRRWGDFLCDDCEALMQPAAGARCEVCWRPGTSPCEGCSARHPAFEAVRSAYAFDGSARDMVHALKYRGISAVAPLMAEAMAAQLKNWGIQVEATVAVPMAGTRQRRRGYNQAALLANEIGQAMDVEVLTGMIRRRPGASQVDQPNKEARWRNAAVSYEAGPRPARGNILLVDDAMTTGATLDACARILKETGATRVYGLTFARES